jgi:ribosomal protein S18
MTVRYERQLERLEELKADGVKLVWIEPHANCSERCEKYQGKLYSLDGSTGKIDGIDYRPLEYATNNPVDRYVTRAGKVYQNGCITGFNCRHQLIPYEEGNRPMPIPADVIARRRAIEQRQREMERDIRAQKRKAVLMRNVSPEAYNKAREKASRMTELYEEYSRKNDAAFSRERTSIFTDALGKVLYENLAEQYIPH